MSRYLNDFKKQALWETYNRKCFYCRELLNFKNIHVDHIIPQSIFRNNTAFIRKKYNLAPIFDFNSIDNFSPSCQSCNIGRKRGDELEFGIPLWLNEINSKKTKIIALATKLEKELSLDLPDQLKEFFVLKGLGGISDVPSVNYIRKRDIPILKCAPFHDGYYPLFFKSPNGKGKVKITNLNEYESYKEIGYEHSGSTPEAGLSSSCDSSLFLFRQLEKAIPIINRINFENYYKNLPIDIFYQTILTSLEQDSTFCGLNTVEDFIKSNKEFNYRGVVEKSETSIRISSNSLEINIKYTNSERLEIYHIQEVLQADFSGEGYNEVLLFIHYRTSGTFHFKYPCCVRQIDGEWKILNKGID